MSGLRPARDPQPTDVPPLAATAAVPVSVPGPLSRPPLGPPLGELSVGPSALPDRFPHDATTQGFRHVGLTSHEAQMYHALLRSGPSTARAAIQFSRLDRATGYRMLSRLRARGLVAVKGVRPQRFVALDAVRLMVRVSDLARDNLELRRIVRQVYAAELPPQRRSTPAGGLAPGSSIASLVPPAAPGSGLSLRESGSSTRLATDNAAISRVLGLAFSEARREVCGLVHPRTLPAPQRAEMLRRIEEALAGGIALRLVFDYHPAEVEFLTDVLRRVPTALDTMSVRFYAMQFARLLVCDNRVALRWLPPPSGSSRDPDLVLASEEPDFVRTQAARFENTWRAGVPVEQALASPRGSIIAPPTCSRELRAGIDRLNRRARPEPPAPDGAGF
jgi:hypothetical protein